jgi:hypothetical protein
MKKDNGMVYANWMKDARSRKLAELDQLIEIARLYGMYEAISLLMCFQLGIHEKHK